jgi:hypothetical protein
MTTSRGGGITSANYLSHYDPAKNHHRAWLKAVLDPAALQEGSELRDLWLDQGATCIAGETGHAR